MTGTMARAAATYQEVQVASRSPLELVVMLYDGAIDALRQTIDAMGRRDLVTKRATIRKALQIVQHLQSSLDMDSGGDVAAHLDTLYGHVVARVLDANVRGDARPLDEAIRMLSDVRDAWSQIAHAVPAEPVAPGAGPHSA